MLARAWRLLAWIIVVPSYAVLKGLADPVARKMIDIRDEDLRAARHEIASLKSKTSILDGELEELNEWRAKLIETHKAETASKIAARSLATEAAAGRE